MRVWIVLGLAGLTLTGCLVDLYGGDPRLQVKNSSTLYVRNAGIGDPDNPSFKHDFDPVLKPGKSSEVINLPASGDLKVWVRISDSASTWDTVLFRPQSVDLGEFRTIEVSGEARGALSTLP